MAGLIKREDIDEVRQRTDIKEVVEAYVTLKSAGIGSWKGLCPFHDERSPSFHVRPQMGSYHCFGCGEGGDVISFVQKLDHTSFSETVEKLAARIGFELHYEDGGTVELGGSACSTPTRSPPSSTGTSSSPREQPLHASSCRNAASTARPRSSSASATHPRAGTRC
jgi:hypothetical protein